MVSILVPEVLAPIVDVMAKAIDATIDSRTPKNPQGMIASTIIFVKVFNTNPLTAFSIILGT